MKTRRDKLDAIFSKLVRERADWTCERCGKVCKDGSKLDCSHLYSRRKQSVRFDPLNAVAHCMACHQFLGENPVVFADWIRGYLGGPAAFRLYDRSQSLLKRTEKDKEALYQRMKAEHKRMLELRSQGIEGRLEFTL